MVKQAFVAASLLLWRSFSCLATNGATVPSKKAAEFLEREFLSPLRPIYLMVSSEGALSRKEKNKGKKRAI